VTNTLAYHGSELITAVKSIMALSRNQNFVSEKESFGTKKKIDSPSRGQCPSPAPPSLSRTEELGKLRVGTAEGGGGAGAWERLLFAWALPGVAKTASPWQKKKNFQP